MGEPGFRLRLGNVEPNVLRMRGKLAQCLLGLPAGRFLVGSGRPGSLAAGRHLAEPEVAALAELVPVRVPARLELGSVGDLGKVRHGQPRVWKEYGKSVEIL